MTSASEPTTPAAQLSMSIALSEPSRESEERWAQRADVLAKWLFEKWHSDQRATQDGLDGAEQPALKSA